MSVIDVSGKIVEEYGLKPDEKSININTSGYSNGVYTIEIISDHGLIKSNRWIIYH